MVILPYFVQLKVIHVHNYEVLIMCNYPLFIIAPPTFSATPPRQKLETKLGTKLEAKLETKLGTKLGTKLEAKLETKLNMEQTWNKA